jgi:hypothetical protein
MPIDPFDGHTLAGSQVNFDRLGIRRHDLVWQKS